MAVFGIFEGSFTDVLIQFIINPLLWLLIIILIIIITLIVLKIRKKRAMKFTAIEYIEIGDNRIGKNILKCGWIGKNLYLRGLWWTGRKVMRTSDMEEILNFSEEDFQVINGRKAVEFYRHPISRHLVPLHKTRINGTELLADIPPAEYADASTDIIRNIRQETTDWRDKLIAYGIIAFIIVFALVSIILIIQFTNGQTDKAQALFEKAGASCLQSATNICQEICKLQATQGP